MKEPTQIEYLNWLRSELRLAFFVNKKRRIQASPSKDNPYLTLLYEDIIDELDLDGLSKLKAPGIGTLIKFLCKPDAIDFDPLTIMVFEDYVFKIKEKFKNKDVNRNPDYEGLIFTGAKLIDSIFCEKLNVEERELNYSKFYLRESDNDFQWYGIIRHWDCERSIEKDVMDELLNCFNWKSKVTAVVHGDGGCGKTLFLMRLAVILTKHDFKILWVENPNDFCDKDLDIIRNTLEKYLVFIEDWTVIENDIPLTTKLLNNISKLNNIRLIIGDREVDEKPYRRYVLKDNYFELSSHENKKILSWILGLYDIWEDSANKILVNPEFYNAPIFLILFTIARCSEGTDYPKTNDIRSLFQEIIESDQKRIEALVPGLAKALYYLCCIKIEYGIDFSWQAFLKLSGHYQNNIDYHKKAISQLQHFDKNSYLVKILSHYLSITELVHPKYENIHLMNFHHDLLIEALSNPLKNEWYFDTNIKLEIVEHLIDFNELAIASDLFWKPKRKEYEENFVTQLGIPSFLPGAPKYNDVSSLFAKKIKLFEKQLPKFENSFGIDLFKNHLLKKIYGQIEYGNSFGSIPWRYIIFEVTAVFWIERYDCYFKIFSTIKNMGYKSPYLDYVHGLCLTDSGVEIFLEEGFSNSEIMENNRNE